MKVRCGFVSNSSSSSFIVLRKNTGLTRGEILTHNRAKMIEAIGECEGKDEAKVIAWTEDGKTIVIVSRIEWGAEESIEKIIKEMCKSMGVKEEDMSIEWGD